MNIELSDRELATVLAALRYWANEKCGEYSYCGERQIASNMNTLVPLTDIETNALCERINR